MPKVSTSKTEEEKSVNPHVKGLTGDQIKWIAIAAMLVDHIAWAFVPFSSVQGQLMHVIGRITAPTMCFFIAEGYYYTRNVKKYALRLGAFALISQIPYTFFEFGKLEFVYFKNGKVQLSDTFLSVIYTLLLSLLAVWTWDKIQNKTLRLCAVIGLCVLAIPGDWMFVDIMFSIIFWIYRGDFKNQARWFAIFAGGMVLFCMFAASMAGRPVYGQLFQAGIFLCLPILSLYNGQRGGGKNSKWTFYVFYPAHLLILKLLRLFI